MLTIRDKEYLKAIFLLKGASKPVGPSQLSKSINVTKEAAFQEMKRLEILGLGKYIKKKGLKLNKNAILTIESDFKKHHILEKFLRKSLNISHEEACKESINIDPYISEKLIDNISKKIGPLNNCDCGSSIKLSFKLKDVKNCNWIKKTVNGEIKRC